jgi:nicotinate-nucleotide adenylyltransferase
MTRPGRIGILGGTFDPIHCGHLDIGNAAQTALGLTAVMLIPAQAPPHRPQPVASSYHRFAMTALAVAGRRGWQASDLELKGPTPSYTTTTLQELQQQGYSPRELYFIIGADAFSEIATWKDYPGILDRAHFAVVSRPGCPVSSLAQRVPELRSRMVTIDRVGSASAAPAIFLIDASTADVSSTAIRRRCMEGASITGLVVPGVEQHIEQHRLYASTASDRRDRNGLPTAGAGRLHGKG